MGRKGDNIRLRKDGRWEGRYSKGIVDGKRKQGSVFGKTYEEAKEKLAKAREEYKRQQQEENTVPPSSYDLFSVIAGDWYKELWPKLKPSSAASYRNTLDNRLLPEFGNRKIEEITRDQVVGFVNGMQMKFSPKTAALTLTVLKQVFFYAEEVRGFRVVNIRSIKVKQPKQPLRVLSQNEQDKMTNALLDDLTFANLGILIALYSGVRVGELCALKWGDISEAEGFIHVEKTMMRIQSHKAFGETDTEGKKKTQIIITRPKSDCSIRDIPVPEEILPIIENMRQEPHCYLLTGKEDKYIEPRTMENRFNALMKKCDITGATFHTCRHTFATRCIELGFDPRTLSEILGHSSVKITLDRYVHPSMKQKKNSMDRLRISM